MRVVLAFAILLLSTSASIAVNWVYAKKVDYKDTYAATDRFWYYKNADGSNQVPPVGFGTYPSVEWEYGVQISTEKIVCQRGQNIKVEIQFKNQSGTAVTGVYSFDWVKLNVPAGYNSRSASTINLTPPASQNVSLAAGQTITVEVIIGGVPDYVAYGDLVYQSKMLATSGAPSGLDLIDEPWGYAGPEYIRLYLVDAAPTEHQSNPWTDALDLSCDFAFGKAGAADVTRETTFGLYWSSVFAYNLGTPGIPSEWVTNSNHLRLRELLDGLALDIQPGNCVDVSCFLQVLTSALGVSSNLHGTQSDPYDAFITNKVVPIGSNGADNGLYVHLLFTYHQQVITTNGVNDAALAFYHSLSGSVYMNPAGNWTMPGYWQTMASPLAYGLVYRKEMSGDELVTHSEYPFKVIQPNPAHKAAETNYESDQFDLQGYSYVP